METREAGAGVRAVTPSPPSELEIRSALRARLMRAHDSGEDTTILHELGIRRGQVRIDLAVVNGLMHGYEIKSDRDSLRRLSGQVELYSQVLDRATLVVGARHLDDAVGILPDWWGVTLITWEEGTLIFRTLRPAESNPQRDSRALVELLWRDHTLDLLAERNLDIGVRSKPRAIRWDRACSHFDIEEIASAVRFHLKARTAPATPQ